MNVFLEITLCFFALVGILYLARDGYRIWLCRRLERAHFVLAARRKDFSDERELERTLLQLCGFLIRPEAKYLVREVLLTDSAPHEVCGAEEYDYSLSCIEEGELIRRL